MENKISVEFSAQVTGFKRSMSQIQESVKETSRAVSQKAKDMGDAFKPISAGVTAVAGVSVLASSQMEEGFNQLGTKLGAQGDQLKGYENIVKGVAKTGVGSWDEISRSLVSVKQNFKGLDGKELESATSQAMNLAQVMDTDVNEVTKTAGIMAKNFKISHQEAFDLIAKGYQNNMDFAGDYMDTISEYSVYFDGMGFSANDMFNILKNGAEAGAFNLDKVGDAVKEFNIRAKDGSKSTNDAFTSLGFNAEKMGDTFAKGGDGAKKAYTQVVTELSKIEDEQERNTIGVALFGSQYEDMEKDVIASSSHIKDGIGEVNGTSKKMADDNKTFTSEMKGAWSSISIALQPLGDKLKDIALAVMPVIISAVEKLSKGFTGLSPTMQTVVLAFGGLLAIAPIILTAFAGLMAFIPSIVTGFTLFGKGIKLVGTGLGSLGKVFKLVGAGFKILTRILMKNPWVLLVVALVSVAVLIYKNWDEISIWLQGAWEWIKSTAETVWNGIASFFTAIWNGIVAVAKAVWDGIKWYFTTVFNIYKTIIITVWTTIKSWLSTAWNVIKTTAVTVFNALKERISAVFTAVKTKIISVWNTIKSWLSTAWNTIKSTASTIFSALRDKITSIFTAIKTKISTVWTSVKTTVINTWNSIKERVTSAVTGVKERISQGWEGVKDKTRSAFEKVKSLITDPIRSAKDKVGELIRGIKDFFRDMKLKIPTPSMPKLPHFSLTTGSKKVLGKEISYPTGFDVNWYATGGVFKGSQQGSIVGIGEGGHDEAVLPLSNKSRMKPFAHAVASMMPAQESNGASGVNIQGDLTIPVTLELDGENFVQKTIKITQEQLEKIAERQGRLSGIRG